MSSSEPATYFAPAARQEVQLVRDAASRLRCATPSLLIDASPVSMLLINEHRQIVLCNLAFRKLAAGFGAEHVVGLRPGEALGCVHARIMDAGCGTSRFCRRCGAAIAIMESLRGHADTQECHMLRSKGEALDALDLQVFAAPVSLDGQDFTLFTALDISHEKRLQTLERTLMHDMINASGGIEAVSGLLLAQPEAGGRFFPVLAESSARLLLDVLYFRDLAAAERGALKANPAFFDQDDLMRRLCAWAEQDAAGSDKHILIGASRDSERLFSDERILGHVLRNMLLNALEASERGESVRIDCAGGPDFAEFRVWNPAMIPEAVQETLFKRYVSTKGEGRGLGTWVMKLFGERILGGRVTFSSTPGEGTMFRIRLPRGNSAEQSAG